VRILHDSHVQVIELRPAERVRQVLRSELPQRVSRSDSMRSAGILRPGGRSDRQDRRNQYQCPGGPVHDLTPQKGRSSSPARASSVNSFMLDPAERSTAGPDMDSGRSPRPPSMIISRALMSVK